MDPVTGLKLAAIGSVVLIVLSVGMGARFKDVLAFLGEPILATKAMLSMFVAMPLLALALGKFLPLAETTLITLLALSVAPMPPLFPGKAHKLGGSQRYSLSLFVLASLVVLVAAPVALAIDERVLKIGLPFNAMAVAKTLAITILLPLSLGLLISEFAPSVADKLRPIIASLGKWMLVAAAIVLLVVAWPAIRLALGEFTLIPVLVMVTGGLLIGHWLGGPDAGNRHALAAATALRHPGVAIAIASESPTADIRLIAGTVLIYLLAGAVLSTLYGRWQQKRADSAA